MLTNEKAIDLAIKTIQKQMKNKPGGGYKVKDEKIKYIDIIKRMEELKEDLKRPINKCKNCENFSGKLNGTGLCFPVGDKYTSSRNWEDGCTALFTPKKGKNLLEDKDV